MAQGKSKLKQRPGDSLKKPKKTQAALQKKKSGPGGGTNHSSSAVAGMKAKFQKAINLRIEEEVGQRAKACESKSFLLIKPGTSSSNSTGPGQTSTNAKAKSAGQVLSKKLQRKAKRK